MIEIVVTDKFEQWYMALTHDDAEAVTFVVDLLEKMGTELKYPYTSALKGTHYPLRELRIKAKGKQIRVFYCFDPKRQAVLLLGGSKTGNDRFYTEFVPQAEKLWQEYLAKQQGV